MDVTHEYRICTLQKCIICVVNRNDTDVEAHSTHQEDYQSRRLMKLANGMDENRRSVEDERRNARPSPAVINKGVLHLVKAFQKYNYCVIRQETISFDIG